MPESRIKFFSGQTAFRKWLEKNHQKKTEVIVGYYKVFTGKPSLTWSESVDQALCFGWIDGIRRSLDEERYCIRFTPRKPGSNWSQVNLRKVGELTKLGQMAPAGLEVFYNRKPDRENRYSFEKEKAAFSPEFEKLFRKNKKAWAFFTSRPPSYRRTLTFWVMAAKQDKTRVTRLEKLISASEEQRRIY